MKFLSTTTLIIFCFAVLAAFFVAMTTLGTRRWRIKDYSKFNVLFSMMLLAALVLAFNGMKDISSTPYSGYRVSTDYRVVQVDPNGPAALGGVQKGDLILELGKVRTENLQELSMQPRAKVGESVRLMVLRDKTPMELWVSQAALPTRETFLAWAGYAVAFFMLALGLMVYWRLPNKTSTLFFLSNFCFALAFMRPPYLQSFFLRNMVAMNFVLFITMGFAFFLHLAVTFPRPKPLIAEGGFWELIIYVPAPLLAINYLGLRLFQPRADLLVNRVLHSAFALLVLACLTLTLAALIHSLRTETIPRLSKVLRILLVSSLVGIVPATMAFLLETFVPELAVPGQGSYGLLAILVPASFGWAFWKVQRSQEPSRLRQVA